MSDQARLKARMAEAVRNAKPIPLYRALFNQAEFYNQGSIAALERLGATGNAGLAGPAIMCQSFSVELLLKCFLVLPHPAVMKYAELKSLGVDLRGHLYSFLFDRIDEQYKDTIATAFSGRSGRASTAVEFRAHLLELGDDPFVAWRYVYEKDEIRHLNLELFGQVIDALGVSAEREIKKGA